MIKYFDDKICFVCCYFNHTNSKSRFYNFLYFLESFKKHNITLIVVEAFSKESKFRVNSHWKNTISIKVKQNFWIKEMLLNIGITDAIKNNIEKIGWIDCDILVNSNNFKELIINNKKSLFQIFGSAKQHITNNNHIFVDSTCKIASMLGFEKTLLNRVGEVGYGYVYSKELLQNNLLYEYAIVGTGDWLNLLGYIQLENARLLYNDRFFNGTTIEFYNSYIMWCMKNKKILESDINFLDIEIEVLNHGNYEDRQYVEREKIIKIHKFNPNKDIKFKRNVFEILNQNLLSDISNYFVSRNDDRYFYKKTYKDMEIGLKNVNKDEKTTVLSLHTNNTMEITTNEKVIRYRKQGSVRKGETVLLNNSTSYTHTFFTYIIENYNKIPNIVKFKTDKNIKFKIELTMHDIKKHNKKYFLDIIKKYKEKKSEYFFESILNNLTK